MTNGEAGALFRSRDREPELRQADAVIDQHLFKKWRLPDEFGVLLRSAVAHDTFNAGAVVPGTIEEHDLSGSGKVIHIALEVPLGAFLLRRLLQSYHPRTSGIEMFHEALDGATLASCIPALEHDHVPVVIALRPLLQLQQFDLEQTFLLLILVAGHAMVVGVVLPPGVHRGARRIHQYWIVVVIVVNSEVVELSSHGRKLTFQSDARVTTR